MNRSLRFNKVKEYYDNGYWSKSRVADAVKANWITASEYYEIVGESYICIIEES